MVGSWRTVWPGSRGLWQAIQASGRAGLALLFLVQQRLVAAVGVCLISQAQADPQVKQRRVGARAQGRVHHGQQRQAHAQRKRRGRGRIQAVAEAVALVRVRLGHQGGIAQVGAVQGEDGGREEAAIPRLGQHSSISQADGRAKESLVHAQGRSASGA